MSLAASHCLVHPSREAVARCPECRSPCCRECVTEHEGRFLCAACLRRRTRPAGTSRRGPGAIWAILPIAAGIVLTTLLFHVLGLALLQIPDEWHEGTVIGQELGTP